MRIAGNSRWPGSSVYRALLFWGLFGFSLTALSGESIRILTEEFPPYSFTENGRITGFSTEVVEAVLKEIKVQGDFQSMPWARAYELVQNTESTLIYSIGRSKERERLFKWVGVIAPADYYLFSLQGKNLKFDQLEQAKKYQIGTVNEDVGEQFLVSKGFIKGKNLQSSVKYGFNYEKLKLGRVDLWIIGELTAYYLARQAGDDPAKVLVKAYRVSGLGSDGYYMAFGINTPDALVDRFRTGLETIKRNGTFDALKRKWL
ncbi:MAG: transporter substrate-binding domain-containing protein [Rhodoferax sp.]